MIERLFSEGHETLVMCGGSMFYIDAVCNSLSHVPTADLAVRAQLQKRLEAEGIESLRETLRTLDPEAYATMDLSNTQRVFRAVEICLTTGMPYTSFKASNVNRSFEIQKVGLTRPREELYARIDRRVEGMLSAGLVEEVRGLQRYRDLTALKTVGYREIFSYLDGKISLEKAAEDICLNTHHYAKRQLSWWRRDNSIRWITPED